MLQELEININSDPPSKEEVQKSWDEWFAADEKLYNLNKIQNRIFEAVFLFQVIGMVIISVLIKFDVLSLYYFLPFIVIGALTFGWYKFIGFAECLDLDWILPIEKEEQEEINNMIGKSSVVDFYISKVNAMQREFMRKELMAIKAHFE